MICISFPEKALGKLNSLIPHFIDGDKERPNPIFEPFKRISKIDINKYALENECLVLRLIDEAWVSVDYICCSVNSLEEGEPYLS